MQNKLSIIGMSGALLLSFFGGVLYGFGTRNAVVLEISHPLDVVLPEAENNPTVDIIASDAHQRRLLEELRSAYIWADGAPIFISETGVPTNDNSQAYADLMKKFFQAANLLDIHVTAWAVGERWGDYRVVPFEPSLIEDNALSYAFRENLGTDTYFRGLNVAGAEFGLDPDAGGEEGELGTTYVYHEDSEIWSRIRSRGFTHIRLPFRLERLFDVRTGAFDEQNREALLRAFDKARKADIKIVLDPHNYGALRIDGRKEVLGGDAFTLDLYKIMLRNIAALSVENTDVVDVIGLMNEPKNLDPEDWERFAQEGLNTLRASAWQGHIEVPTGNWQGIQDVLKSHDAPWITDPLEDYSYGIHQYFDFNSSGSYDRSYSEDERELRKRYRPGPVTFPDPR